MLYLGKIEDSEKISVACLDASKDSWLSFRNLNENLFCIGGALLYNFVSEENIRSKMNEMNIMFDESYVILTFEEILEIL